MVLHACWFNQVCFCAVTPLVMGGKTLTILVMAPSGVLSGVKRHTSRFRTPCFAGRQNR